MLVVLPDQHDFEFSIEGAERKIQTEYSSQIQEIGIFDNQKVPKSFHFKVTFGIQKIQTTR